MTNISNFREMRTCILLIVSARLFVNMLELYAQDKANVSGVYPRLVMVAKQIPRTEVGTRVLFPYVNRFLHGLTNQLIIGLHIID